MGSSLALPTSVNDKINESITKRMNGRFKCRSGAHPYQRAWKSYKDAFAAEVERIGLGTFSHKRAKIKQKVQENGMRYHPKRDGRKFYTIMELARICSVHNDVAHWLGSNIVVGDCVNTLLPNLMPDWKHQPEQIKNAYRISIAKRETQGKGFIAYTLQYSDPFHRLSNEIHFIDGSVDDPVLTDDSLNFLKKLKSDFVKAIGRMALLSNKKIIFGLELTKERVPHIHMILFDTTSTEMHEIGEALRRTVGEWTGEAKEYQDHAIERYFFEDALGWLLYSLKHGLCSYAQQSIKSGAKQLFNQVRDEVNSYLSDRRSA